MVAGEVIMAEVTGGRETAAAPLIEAGEGAELLPSQVH